VQSKIIESDPLVILLDCEENRLRNCQIQYNFEYIFLLIFLSLLEETGLAEAITPAETVFPDNTRRAPDCTNDY
jgi:hypothetical protein